MKSQANLYLRQAEPRKALTKADEAGALIDQLEADRRTQAQRDLQSILVKTYRDLGESEKFEKRCRNVADILQKNKLENPTQQRRL